MDEWIEFTHTNAPLLSRSLQPAHIFFRGDVALAQQRLGVARKILGYTEFDQQIGNLGFTAKLVTLADGTVIRAICHGTQRTMLIDVQGIGKEPYVAPPAHGYQFYTTTVAPQFHQCSESDYFPVGSAVFAPIPEYDPAKPVPPGAVELKAFPTGSFVERAVGFDHPKYDLSAMKGADCLASLSKISKAMNSALMVTGSWQVNGIAEYVSYHGLDFYNVLMANPALHQTWLQGDLINSLGLRTILSPSEYTDHHYDAAPCILGPWSNPGPPTLKTKVPDSDWFGRATLRDASHPEWGTRHFVIMSAADGAFHCWPLYAPIGGDYSIEYGAYGGQAYKGNIVKEYGRVSMPQYPDWVTLPDGAFRDFKKSDDALLNPRTTWSFNRDGTRAIGVMMERKTTEGTFRKINYTPYNLGNAVFRALNQRYGYHTSVSSGEPGGLRTEENWPITLDKDVPAQKLNIPHIPNEAAIEPLQVKPTSSSTEFSEIQVDRLGFVEVELIVTLTGPELNDFFFIALAAKKGKPEDLNTIEHGALVDVAYAKPLAWDGGAVLNELGTKKIGLGTEDSIENIRVDDVLCLFIKAYRHTDQTAVLDAYDGEVTIPEPSKVKALFGKGYPGNHKNVLTLPLAQIHGCGYTYTPDPEIALPPDPHQFVHRTDQTFVSEYPFVPENDEHSKILYTYKAKITDLDLGSLSFYYHVRCVSQERKEKTIQLQSGVFNSFTGEPLFYDWHPIEYQARSWCVVSLMGRVADETTVGSADILLSWLKGWVYEGGALALEPEEELIDPKEKRPFRGFGQQQGPLFPMRAKKESYLGVPFSTPQKQEHQFVSWRRLLEDENPTLKEFSWLWHDTEYFSAYLLRESALKIKGYEKGVMPWFMLGPCAALIDLALSILYLETYGLKASHSTSDSYSYSDRFITVESSGSSAESWGVPGGFNLYTLTEESTKSFLIYAYNLFSSFFINYQSAHHTFVEERWGDGSMMYNSTTDEQEYASYHVSDWLAQNPFLLANPEFSAETFAKATYKYFWKFIKYFQTIGPQYTMAPEWSDDEPPLPTTLVGYFLYTVTLEPRCPPLLTVFPRGSGTRNANYNKVYPWVYYFPDLWTNQHIIREFEYGNLVYTHLMHTHFSPVINDQTSAIRITPEGHFSYCKQDIFEFNRPVVPEAIFYADYVGSDEMRHNDFPRTPKVAIPWYFEFQGLPNYNEELTKNDIDWKPLEGVGWFYGALRCSHLELYEKAYHTPLDEKHYYHDRSCYQPVKPDATEYKPEFKITAASDNKGYLVNPVMQYDGNAYDWRYWIYPWGQLPHALISSQFMYPEYNQDRKYIRLSPLFF